MSATNVTETTIEQITDEVAFAQVECPTCSPVKDIVIDFETERLLCGPCKGTGLIYRWELLLKDCPCIAWSEGGDGNWCGTCWGHRSPNIGEHGDWCERCGGRGKVANVTLYSVSTHTGLIVKLFPPHTSRRAVPPWLVEVSAYEAPDNFEQGFGQTPDEALVNAVHAWLQEQ